MPGFESDKREPGKYSKEDLESKREEKDETPGTGERQGREGETPVATTDGGFWSWFRKKRS